MAGQVRHPKRSRVELEISPSGIGDQPMKRRRRGKKGDLASGRQYESQGFSDIG